MPTLFSRIFAHHKNANVPILTLQQRGELGKKVIARYEKLKVPRSYKRYTRVTSNESDFNGAVINYPIEFRDEIDKQIKAYYKRLQARKKLPSLTTSN